MGNQVLAISIMAHPSRRAEAEALAASLGDQYPTKVVYDPDPEGPPGTLRTARLAWRPWHPGQTHHLLVQDDAVPRADFGRSVDEILEAHPSRWITLATEWGSKTSWVCRAAALSNRPYGPSVDAYVPVWGLMMPAGEAEQLAQWLIAVDDSVADDLALNDFTRARAIETPLITVPNLIEHGTVGSLIGNDSMLGHRKSALTTSQPVPDGWWSRPELREVAGLPFIMYWQPRYARALVAPGHDGYDFRSLSFDAEQLAGVRKAWQQFGIDVDGPTADAFASVALTFAAARAYVSELTLETPDALFTESLVDSAIGGSVLGVLRQTLTTEHLDQVAVMRRFLWHWAMEG